MKEIYISEVLEKDKLSKEEIVFLLELTDKEDLDKLFRRADEVRRQFIGDKVYVRGILEFSNYCKNDCLYCGIRSGNNGLKRYRINIDEIVSIADNAVNKLGFKTVLLQSGEDDHYSAEVISELIRKILEKCDCRVALSLGERTIEEYKKFFSAGAKRCLIRFETSNKELFESLHPSGSLTKNSFEDRVSLIKSLKEIGYQVGTGPMIGLPGQDVSDLADDILLYEELGINMAGMGPFISHPETPLVGEKDGSFEMSLKMIAVTRLVCKDVFISATTALQTLNPVDGRERALKSGANLLMPNITPKKYREFYQLYPDKVCIYENPFDCAHCVNKVVISVGRRMGEGYGDPRRS